MSLGGKTILHEVLEILVFQAFKSYTDIFLIFSHNNQGRYSDRKH